ncbi:uncharacterized protein BO72DRAFT_495232 [Aspergillus fijiensis CBS 313.89]|uniref:Uncharacterized protein n=1 Tax=Aspergillus fijiensis CBS 313.89 TaxID=1448319 RepID=A0A8G1VZP0_9EURO|nr:uncharacterized protein BO72DRAFT_495232 [Aspergillus fijiensis CBS 313.89]RAK78497.1 hypothetical protein BO72DRAFT_495232 [Aspergillus fijiensis CBS 313.89]
MQRIFLSSPADWRLGPSAYRYTTIGPDPFTTLLLARRLDGRRLSRAMFPPPQLRANWNPHGVDYVTVMTVAVALFPFSASSSVVPRPLRADLLLTDR